MSVYVSSLLRVCVPFAISRYHYAAQNYPKRNWVHQKPTNQPTNQNEYTCMLLHWFLKLVLKLINNPILDL